MTGVELVCCPKCGSMAVRDNYDWGYFWVECRHCGFKGKECFEDYGQAIRLWNEGVYE